MRTIFLIELENSKYFVFASSFHINFPIELFLEASIIHEYIRKYKPLRIANQLSETHFLDVDIYVKKQMLVHGIDNVRGGSYSSIVLTPEQITFLTTELYPKNNYQSTVIKGILDKYANSPWTNENLIIERELMKTKYEIYKKEKRIYDKLVELNIDEINKDLDWLEETCEFQRDVFLKGQTPIYRLSHDNNRQKYKDVLYKMHKTYQTFMTLSEKVPLIRDDLPIQYPEFLFDDYIFHGHYVNENKERVHWFCEQYRFFLSFIENRLEEYEFDLSCWGQYPEENFIFSIALLDMCIL